ncbi:MAG: hypothetical protein GX259_10690 [Bacteroidales bacterium]|nr:hypothetical protein [Bacteroidales bacterium]
MITKSPYKLAYKFSAKEKDAETGFNYFGARYYVDYMYVWLSVDPMSDGRPNITPYHYCQNNPVGRIDPNGKWDWKSRAEKFHRRAIKNYGNTNVGGVYYDKNKDEYGFRISKNGFKQYSPEETKDNKGAAVASKSFGVFDKHDLENYEYYQPDKNSRYGTLDDFIKENNGKSYNQIINQKGCDANGFPIGPDMRFVEDPLDEGRYIDMRHFLIVGKEFGVLLGAVGEMLEYGVNGGLRSANKKQDYYSNGLGQSFFYNFNINPNDKKFSEYLKTYLKNHTNYDMIID